MPAAPTSLSTFGAEQQKTNCAPEKTNNEHQNVQVVGNGVWQSRATLKVSKT